MKRLVRAQTGQRRLIGLLDRASRLAGTVIVILLLLAAAAQLLLQNDTIRHFFTSIERWEGSRLG